MILRRITQHVKAQNWFAVGIDFFIVVVGVFIGIQVANWNSNNANRQEERLILERLHDQLSYAETRRNAVENYGFLDLTALSSAREVLFGVVERKTLTQDECNAIGFGHIHLSFADTIPILQELESSGKLAVISNQLVVTALANYSNATKAEAALIAETRQFRVDLSVKFSNLMAVTLTPDKTSESFEEVGSYDRTLNCEPEKMRLDRDFLNAMGNNSSYSLGLFEIGTLPKIKALEELKIAVEKALNIDKSEAK